MNHEETFQKLVNYLFLAIRRPAPSIEKGAGVELVHDSGVAIQIHLADTCITLSASIALHRGYTSSFLLELLQINLNIDSHPRIVVSALAAEELIVIWGKEDISTFTPESFVNYFDKFCHHINVINKYNIVKSRNIKELAASNLYNGQLTSSKVTQPIIQTMNPTR